MPKKVVLFFLTTFFYFFSIIAQANDDNLWSFLLHYKNNTFNIDDPNFYVKGIPSSLSEERQRTLTLLSEITPESKSFVCQFPARFKFIKNHHPLIKNAWHDYPLQTCSDYATYNARVPVDNIYLVFAAENISSPTSMMGHVFIRLEGENANSDPLNHAFSYFAIINSFNPLLLVTESLITGQEGRFSLMPYHEALFNYTEREGRSVWEYQLDASEETKQLIKDHLFELKDIRPSYYFTKYNCATVLYDIITLIEPELNSKRNEHKWITPRDLVKDIIELDVIKSKTIYINPIQGMKWLKWEVSNEVKTLRPEHFLEERAYLKSLAEKSIYNHLYINYLNDYYFSKNEISKQTLEQVKAEIPRLDDHFHSYQTSPEKAPNDSQYSLGVKKINNTNSLNLSILPASHKIMDSSAAFFTENALELGEIELALYENDVKLEQLTLYTVKNINSVDPHAHNLSWGWGAHFDRNNPTNLERTLGLNLEFGIGKSIDLQKNLLIYNLNYLGARADFKSQLPFFRLEVGSIYNLSNIFKVHLEGHRNWTNGYSSTEKKLLISYGNSAKARFVGSAGRKGVNDKFETTIELKLVNYF